MGATRWFSSNNTILLKHMFKKIKTVLINLKRRVDDHFLGLVAAGVAFYAFLSIFPAIAAVVSIYGLLADPLMAQNHLNAVSQFFPVEMQELMSNRVQELASRQTGTLTLGLMVGLLLSLWSANKAMKAITKGLNIAYESEERRGFFKLNAITLALTLVTAICGLFAVGVIIVLPLVVQYFLYDESAEIISILLSWSALIVVLAGLFTFLYRYAPYRRERPELKHSIPGAVLSTVIVLAASLGFSFYVANFSKYNEEYGAFSAAVVTLLWLYLTSFIFLLGAELNGGSRSLTEGEHNISDSD